MENAGENNLKNLEPQRMCRAGKNDKKDLKAFIRGKKFQADKIDEKSPITVAIPVFNGIRTLDICLGSLLVQSHKPSKILVIDDGSFDGSGDLAKKKGFTVIAHKMQRGLANARNTALDACETPYIAFIDSDCQAHPKLLERMVYFLDQPEIAGCGGRGKEVVLTWADRWRKRFLAQDHGDKIKGKSWMLMGLCSAYKVEALKKVGYFNGHYKSHGEDVEMGLRLNKRGFSLLYSPDLMVNHHRNDSFKSIFKTAYNHQFWQAKARLKYGIIPWDQLIYSCRLMIIGPSYFFYRGDFYSGIMAIFLALTMIFALLRIMGKSAWKWHFQAGTSNKVKENEKV